jgi:hypothetical protein
MLRIAEEIYELLSRGGAKQIFDVNRRRNAALPDILLRWRTVLHVIKRLQTRNCLCSLLSQLHTASWSDSRSLGLRARRAKKAFYHDVSLRSSPHVTRRKARTNRRRVKSERSSHTEGSVASLTRLPASRVLY